MYLCACEYLSGIWAIRIYKWVLDIIAALKIANSADLLIWAAVLEEDLLSVSKPQVVFGY